MSYSRESCFIHCYNSDADLPRRFCSTHSDTTLQMLKAGGGATKEEEEILSAFEWSKNEAVLHWDERVSLRILGR